MIVRDQYIAFAVDGAKRMQLLISDLLTFSRVGRTSEGFVPRGSGRARSRRRGTVWTSGSQRDRRAARGGPRRMAPTHVLGDASLLQMLFGNLLGNVVEVPP